MLPTTLEAVAESVAELAEADTSFALAAQQHMKDSTRQPALWSMRLQASARPDDAHAPAAQLTAPASACGKALARPAPVDLQTAPAPPQRAPLPSAFATPAALPAHSVPMAPRSSSGAPQSTGFPYSTYTMQANSSALSRRATLNASEAPDSFSLRPQEQPELGRSARPPTLREVLAQWAEPSEGSSAHDAQPVCDTLRPRLAEPLSDALKQRSAEPLGHTAPARNQLLRQSSGHHHGVGAGRALLRGASGSSSSAWAHGPSAAMSPASGAVSKAGTPRSDVPAGTPLGVSSELYNEGPQQHVFWQRSIQLLTNGEHDAQSRGKRRASGHREAASEQITPAACSDAALEASRGRSCQSGVVARVPVAAKQAKRGRTLKSRLLSAKQLWSRKRAD